MSTVEQKYEAARARIVSGTVSLLRWARYPDGRLELQGGYQWQSADRNDAGIQWQAIETVDLTAAPSAVAAQPKE